MIEHFPHLQKKVLAPGDFTEFPYSSTFRKIEAEVIAVNIMVILSRTGNKFRDFSWKEYKKERLKDGEFTESEREYFDKVIGYCKSSDTAGLFSKIWREVE